MELNKTSNKLLALIEDFSFEQKREIVKSMQLKLNYSFENINTFDDYLNEKEKLIYILDKYTGIDFKLWALSKKSNTRYMNNLYTYLYILTKYLNVRVSDIDSNNFYKYENLNEMGNFLNRERTTILQCLKRTDDWIKYPKSNLNLYDKLIKFEKHYLYKCSHE